LARTPVLPEPTRVGALPAQLSRSRSRPAMSAQCRLQPSEVRKYRSFVECVAKGPNRPKAEAPAAPAPKPPGLRPILRPPRGSPHHPRIKISPKGNGHGEPAALATLNQTHADSGIPLRVTLTELRYKSFVVGSRLPSLLTYLCFGHLSAGRVPNGCKDDATLLLVGRERDAPLARPSRMRAAVSRSLSPATRKSR
jgi:hypothetical protein